MPKKTARRPNLAAQLAERLVARLAAQRDQGAAYPLPLADLARLCDAGDAAAVLKATGVAAFKARALLIKRKAGKVTVAMAIESPLALAEDADRLAAAPITLVYAIRHKRTAASRAFSIPGLAAGVPKKLQSAFKQVWKERAERGELPDEVAFVRDRGPKLFLWEDIEPKSRRQPVTGASAPEPAPATVALPAAATVARPEPSEAGDFAARFREVFANLDRQKGAHNFVSLVALRRAMAEWPRVEFDRGLRQLRMAGEFSLSAAESLSGISGEEREAGIAEAGMLLLNVSRK